MPGVSAFFAFPSSFAWLASRSAWPSAITRLVGESIHSFASAFVTSASKAFFFMIERVNWS